MRGEESSPPAPVSRFIGELEARLPREQDTLSEIKEAKLAGDTPQPISIDAEISGYLFDFLFTAQDASTSSLVWAVVLLELHPELLTKMREMTLRRWHVRW